MAQTPMLEHHQMLELLRVLLGAPCQRRFAQQAKPAAAPDQMSAVHDDARQGGGDFFRGPGALVTYPCGIISCERALGVGRCRAI